jgi:hypothetical protein
MLTALRIEEFKVRTKEDAAMLHGGETWNCRLVEEKGWWRNRLYLDVEDCSHRRLQRVQMHSGDLSKLWGFARRLAWEP